MRSAARAGQDNATYDYDAMGRLVRKIVQHPGRAETTYYYWVGLNRLAEETVRGDDMFSFKPDTEAGATPADNGWAALIAGDTMEYVTDTGRPDKVLRLTRNNPGLFGGFFINGDSPDPYDHLNPNDVAFNAPAQAMSLWMKGNSTIPPGGGGFLLVATLSNGTLANLSFIFGEGQDYYNPPLLPGDSAGYGYYLGAGLTDNTWKFLDINAEAYLHQFTPDLDVVKIDALIAAPGGGTLPVTLELDDITLKSVASQTQKTYQVNPTAVIGSYVGAAEIDAAAPAANAKWYYHYNDLGTVLATTTTDGWEEGVYEPQFFGNYKKTSGARPDGQGLQSKFFDADAGLYYFQARWNDSDRARWMSEDPIRRKAGHNLYRFVKARPYRRVDPTGQLDIVDMLLPGTCCNKSSEVQYALVDGHWKALQPGDCVGSFLGDDCDGMTCGGGFYYVSALESGTCATPGCDDATYKPRRWTPADPPSGHRSPVGEGGRGSRDGLPPNM